MGLLPPHPPNVPLDLKGAIIHTKGSLIFEDQTKRSKWLLKQRVVAKRNGKRLVRRRAPRRVSTRRRPSSMEASGRSSNAIRRRVKALKELIPNSESTGLDGLFQETADYILALQMRVGAMQMMVRALTGSNDV